jgi:hypothetical protein
MRSAICVACVVFCASNASFFAESSWIAFVRIGINLLYFNPYCVSSCVRDEIKFVLSEILYPDAFSNASMS